MQACKLFIGLGPGFQSITVTVEGLFDYAPLQSQNVFLPKNYQHSCNSFQILATVSLSLARIWECKVDFSSELQVNSAFLLTTRPTLLSSTANAINDFFYPEPLQVDVQPKPPKPGKPRKSETPGKPSLKPSRSSMRLSARKKFNPDLSWMDEPYMLPSQSLVDISVSIYCEFFSLFPVSPFRHNFSLFHDGGK